MSAPVFPAADAAEQPSVISEPWCKICHSPHRAELDEMLRRGDSLAGVCLHGTEGRGDCVSPATHLPVPPAQRPHAHP